eukprot:INCI11697.1.p1 GENE.INCI11697.1~~INCI11697.1.p1  ORF type:complete len:437 (-),score=73.51 INCI11697.1:14-1324(-)
MFAADLKKLTSKKLDAFGANMWVMSPPCQPHTRNGNKGDSDDPRSAGFRNLLKILRETRQPPDFLLLENVEGFEGSQSHGALIEAIEGAQAAYVYEEYILSPTQFGVPNQRDRYYFLARKVESSAPNSSSLSSSESDPATQSVAGSPVSAASKPCSPARYLPPATGCVRVPLRPASCKPGSAESYEYWESANAHCRPIRDFLLAPPPTSSAGTSDPLSRGPIESAGIPGSDRSSGHPVKRKLDEVSLSKSTATPSAGGGTKHGVAPQQAKQEIFRSKSKDKPASGIAATTVAKEGIDPAHTSFAAYTVPTKMLARCGSAIDIVTPVSKQTCCFTKAYTKYGIGTGSVLAQCTSEALSYPIPRDLKHLESLRLRYFSPREVSLLLGFPRDLEFPASLTPRQMYALLGNSLSVTVVAQLLTHLLRGAGVDVAPQDLNK